MKGFDQRTLSVIVLWAMACLWCGCASEERYQRDEAQRRASADAQYAAGIEAFARGDDVLARRHLSAAVAEAPPSAAVYLRLARACEQRGYDERAARYYRKHAAADPDAPTAAAALVAATRLDSALPALLDEAPADTPNAEKTKALTLLGLAASLLALSTAVWRWQHRKRRVSLDGFLTRFPELHGAAAYLIGSLRHEVLKHRVHALGDALRAVESGTATASQLVYVTSRLEGPVSLSAALRAHVDALGRVLGPGLRMREDRRFAAALRAALKWERLAVQLRQGRRVGRRFIEVGQPLYALDRYLGGVIGGLRQTRIDEDLLRTVVAEVLAESPEGRTARIEVSVERTVAGVLVEVPRDDVRCVLRNLLRNALTASSPGAVGVLCEARLELEPTGEELVCLEVMDTSPKRLTNEVIWSAGPDRGLGLVAAVARRYGGGVVVNETVPMGYRKGVEVRFPRTLDS